MAFPSPRTGVPRASVGHIVTLMLQNPDVGDIECTLDADGTYTVTPKRR